MATEQKTSDLIGLGYFGEGTYITILRRRMSRSFEFDGDGFRPCRLTICYIWAQALCLESTHLYKSNSSSACKEYTALPLSDILIHSTFVTLAVCMQQTFLSLVVDPIAQISCLYGRTSFGRVMPSLFQ